MTLSQIELQMTDISTQLWFAALRAPWGRCGLCAALSAGATALVTRSLLAWRGGVSKRNVPRQSHCPEIILQRHAAKDAIPTFGGVAIIAGQLLAFALLSRGDGLSGSLLALASLTFGALGIWDDRLKRAQVNGAHREITAKVKFRLQVLLATALLTPMIAGNWLSRPELGASRSLSGTEVVETRAANESRSTGDQIAQMSRNASQFFIPWRRAPIADCGDCWRLGLLGWFLFVLVGTSNAVNLTDGLDGLAAGCAAIASATLMVGAVLAGDREIAEGLGILHIYNGHQIALYLAGTAGACMGFMVYNAYPARVFMGDGGALALGAGMALASLMLRQEWLLGWCGGIFALETLSVIAQVVSYRFSKKRLFLCAPLHHHFECLGYRERQIARGFWAAAAALAVIGLALLIFGR